MSQRPFPPPEAERRFEGFADCVGCGPTHPHGLRLRFFLDGDEVVGRVVVPAGWEGAPGVAHGGAVTMVLDEYSCAASAFLRDRIVVTGELTVRFQRPCPVGVELRARAWIADDSHPKYTRIEAELSLDGSPIARSHGRFFPYRAD